MTTGKTVALTIWTFVSKVMSLLFNMLSRLVIAFLPRSKHLLISRLQSPSAVILEPKKIKSVTVSIVSPSIFHEVMGPEVTICSDFGAQENKVCHCFPFFHLFSMKWWDRMPWSSFFECWALIQPFHSPLSPSSGGSLVPFHFLPQGWCHLHFWGHWYFSLQS